MTNEITWKMTTTSTHSQHSIGKGRNCFHVTSLKKKKERTWISLIVRCFCAHFQPWLIKLLSWVILCSGYFKESMVMERNDVCLSVSPTHKHKKRQKVRHYTSNFPEFLHWRIESIKSPVTPKPNGGKPHESRKPSVDCQGSQSKALSMSNTIAPLTWASHMILC